MESIQAFIANNPLIVFIIISWSITWKGIALWNAARKEQLVWFIILIIVNTAGILDIYYLLSIGKKKNIFRGSRVNIYSPGFWEKVSIAKRK